VSTRSEPGSERGGVLAIRPFRRLWIALSLSSLGDWLSIVALTVLAATIAGKHGHTSVIGATAAQNAAVSGVWIATLLPALLLGPVAGAIADRLNRRMTMITGDVIRGVLFLSIPIFPNLTWIYIVKFLAGCASLFWNPATSATIPNLVPKDKLEQANQLSLLTTYGTAPVAAGLFSVLALISLPLSHVIPALNPNKVNLALWFNAASYGVSALTIFFLREIRKPTASERISQPSVAKSIWEGWLFLRRTPVLRALALGMSGAFAAAGVVVGLGYVYITDTLHGGSAGWGLVFSAIFVGLALGMLVGARLRDFSLRRLFGLSIAVAAVPLALIALVPNLALVTLFVVILGALAGIAYATGNTIVGLEVNDATRGRTFAFFQSTIQVILFLVIAVSGVVASGFTKLISDITGSGNVQVGQIVYHSVGQNVVLLLAAGVAALCGTTAYRKMDDRKGVPLRQDLMRAIRGEPMFAVAEPPRVAPARRGLLIALEGGEGAGKTTQATLLAIWLRDQGYDVETTQEPGGTKMGMRLRALLLDTAHAGLDARAEALMYAADRAEHVASVIKPALERGTIVITDRFVDSSLAYQGAGRCLPLGEVTRINRWATGGLTPDLTILLDLPPAAGLERRARSADRLEAEPAEFHNRVRAGFCQLADAEPGRYLVLDATQPPDVISREIQDRVRELLPDPVPPSAEAVTSTFPAITEPVRAGVHHEPAGPGGNRESVRASTDHEPGGRAGNHDAGLAGADREAGRASADRGAELEREAGRADAARETGLDHEAGRVDTDHEARPVGGDREAGLAGGGREAGRTGAGRETGRARGNRHRDGAAPDGEPGRVGGGPKPGRTSAG
jgi:dTMP kinase